MHLQISGAVYGGGSGSGGIVSLETETIITDDNNEVTIEVDAGLAGDEDSNSTAGFKGSDGKVYGIYQPSSQPSSHPTEEVRISFYFKCLYLSSFVFVYKQPTDYRPAFV